MGCLERQLTIFLLAMAFAKAAVPEGKYPTTLGDVDSSQCLLQNQIVNEHRLVASDDAESRSPFHTTPLALYEVKTLGQALRMTHERQTELKAHTFLLRRILESLQATTYTTAPGFEDLGAGCCSGKPGQTRPMVMRQSSWRGMKPSLEACKQTCQSMGEKKCSFIDYGWRNSKWCVVHPPQTICTVKAGRKDCGGGRGDTGVHAYKFWAEGKPTTTTTTTTTTTEAPDLAPVGHNCNCGTRVQQWARGKTVETCNDACNSNPSCQSFGFWTSAKSKGHCALFDKACSCNDICSGKPTNVAGGWRNAVYNKDKNLCLAEAATEVPTDVPTDSPTEAPSEPAAEETSEFADLGEGCCAARSVSEMLFKGMVTDLDSCQAKCQSTDNCGAIEYGWKNSKWCTLLPAGTDCSKLAAGPKDCGSGGGDNGVHTYLMLTAETEAESGSEYGAELGAEPLDPQCEKFSLEDNQYVQHVATVVPGATATSLSNVFVSHAGIMNGAYITGRTGKKIKAVRRKKGTKNQYLLGLYDHPYAKFVEITLGLKADGQVTVRATGARYSQVNQESVATKAFSTSEKMTKLYSRSRGQHIARSDGMAGYGVKGLTIKSCLENADAVKAGKELDDLVDDFIDAQSSSEDACHSQLLEARHQLNQLHALVTDLARQVNATEEQIMVYDKMLEERLQEMSELTEWKNTELEKCKVEKAKAIKMFGKLKTELDEMHQIASPTVAMDIQNGKLHEINASLVQMMNWHLTTSIDAPGANLASELKLSALQMDLGELQTELGAHLAPEGHILIKAKHPQVQHVNHDKVSGLIANTQQASEAFNKCMKAVQSSQVSLSHLGGPKKKSDAECQAEKEELQKTYVKAYVELSRLKAEYEELANSSACVDGIVDQFKNRRAPLQKDADKLATAINQKVAELQSLRPRMESASESEKELRTHVKQLANQCDDLGPTVSDLNKVREAIRALSQCPGLSRVKFSLPKWVGTWATFDQNGKTQTDKDQDKAMTLACSKVAPGSRAAEVGEIQGQTVEGIPTTNTASAPLMGACPDCAGTEDKWFQSKHSRICWDPDATLDFGSRRNNCGTGKKAILCVVDRPNIRDIPGGDGNVSEAKKMSAVQLAAIREDSFGDI